jgi:hypothetical protein
MQGQGGEQARVRCLDGQNDEVVAPDGWESILICSEIRKAGSRQQNAEPALPVQLLRDASERSLPLSC